ncbi:hypothetical protein [Halopiger djelfimassiliensis]|uniref:hypothetical protein n=1 Tax=Halopiger djelfimassiliensis TaxID=1293047 RepID=UPI0012B527FA|nr:hypothetical protein [Halopiger djelfimassiliensis]
MSVVDQDGPLIAIALLLVAYAIIWQGIADWAAALPVGAQVLIVAVLGIAGLSLAGGDD